MQGYIAGCTLLAVNQIMLWLIFPSSTAPGSSTEFSHRQRFPMDFRAGPQEGNMFFSQRCFKCGAFQRLIPLDPSCLQRRTQKAGPLSDQVGQCQVRDALRLYLLDGLHGTVWTGEGQESRISPQPHLPSTNRGVSSCLLQTHPPARPKVFNRSAIDCLETGGT